MGKKANQEPLPGMEQRDVPEIEQAADRYRQIRDERCALSKEEAEAKAALIQVMKNKGRSYYSYNGLNVQLSNVENVKVKAKDEEDDEPIGRFTKAEDPAPAQEYLPEAGEPITEEERERLHREAVATWRRERPATEEDEPADDLQVVEEEKAEIPGLGRRRQFIMISPEAEGQSGESDEAEKKEDYQEEWLAALTVEEREKYHAAPCSCGHSRDWHGEEDKEVCDRGCGVCECEQYHCPVCDTKGGHQAICEHYVLGEGTPAQKADDFTAERCDECGRIDGAHTKECSKSDALTFDKYLAYARKHYKRNWSSYARKMELSRDPEMDAKVREWLQQQAGNGVEPEPAKESKKRAKLSPIEAAIDR